ncbi:hypothetical protein HDU93_005413 [Gonapodya sp. JEL0774]|nr:hypothetical protein HDU93_005413 [Gonapodya sp. JEL0774]
MSSLPRSPPDLPTANLAKLEALLTAFAADARDGVHTYELGKGRPLAAGDMRDTKMGFNFATVIVHRGNVVAERYAPHIAPMQPLVSWSMAKLRLEDGRWAVPEWRGKGDKRAGITLRDLLQMRSGLEFNEDYDPAKHGMSDVQQMLFTRPGKSDMGHFAASKPLQEDPGNTFRYASGTSNILSRLLARLIQPLTMPEFLADHLFAPLALTSSAHATCDEVGTMVGSSFVWMSAEDYAKVGMLYARGGEYEGRRVVEREWAEMAGKRTGGVDGERLEYSYHWLVAELRPRVIRESRSIYRFIYNPMPPILPVTPSHTTSTRTLPSVPSVPHLPTRWVSRPHGTLPPYFRASGFEGQFILVVPSLDLVVVRLGRTVAGTEQWERLEEWMEGVVGCFVGNVQEGSTKGKL